MVKTRITNPTASKQSYCWACPGGVNLAPGQSITLDGDVYTHNIPFPGNIRQIRGDLAAGRALVSLITEFNVGAEPDSRPAQATTQPGPSVPSAETAYSDPLKGADTLIDGVKDVGEALDVPAAEVFDAITGDAAEALKDESPVRLDDAIWNRDEADASEVEAKVGVPAQAKLEAAAAAAGAARSEQERARYSKMSKKALAAAVAKAGGSHDMAKEATREEMVDFLVSQLDKETTPMSEAFE